MLLSKLQTRTRHHKISIQHMLHHIMNEYEQVNCVTKKKKQEKRDEGGKSDRANPRQIVTKNTIKF